MDELKELAALTALNNMMEKGYLDVSCIRNVGELLGIKPEQHRSWLILQPLHCMNFNKMPKALQEAIPQLVQDVLGVSPTYTFKSVTAGQLLEVLTPVKDDAPVKNKAKGFLRLLGG